MQRNVKEYSKRELTKFAGDVADFLYKMRADNKISWKDLDTIVSKVHQNVHETNMMVEEPLKVPEKLDYPKWAVAGISAQTVKDFKELNENIAQQCIDFVNAHEDLKEVISKKENEMTYTWGNENQYTTIPEVKFSFSLDALSESVKEGKWCACSDTYMAYVIGNIQTIIEIM